MSDLSITREPELELARLTKENETRPLRLSEAIRIGARLRPQCKEVMFNGVGTCALGAAAEARGWKPESHGGIAFVRDAPGSMRHPGSLFYQIGTRNDRGDTRESIADWLSAQGY